MNLAPDKALEAWQDYKLGVPVRDISIKLSVTPQCVRYALAEICQEARDNLLDDAKATFHKVDEILSSLLGIHTQLALAGSVKSGQLCLGIAKQLMDLYKLSPEQSVQNRTLIVLQNKTDTEVLQEAKRIGLSQIKNFLDTPAAPKALE